VKRLVAPVVEMRIRGFVCLLGTLVFVAISVDVEPACVRSAQRAER
jgi:hypothetical protein